MNTLDLSGDDLHRLTAEALGPTVLPSTINLLNLMRTTLAPWGTDETQVWSARAQGCDEFATGSDAMEAMQRALCLKHFGPSVPLEADNCSDLF